MLEFADVKVAKEASKAPSAILTGPSVQHAQGQVGRAIRRAASVKVRAGCSFVGDRVKKLLRKEGKCGLLGMNSRWTRYRIRHGKVQNSCLLPALQTETDCSCLCTSWAKSDEQPDRQLHKVQERI
jgi:hypothetical protein